MEYTVVCNDTNVNNYQFVENQGKLWLAYSSADILKTWDFQSGTQKAMLQVSSLSIGNPSVFNYEGELYAYMQIILQRIRQQKKER